MWDSQRVWADSWIERAQPIPFNLRRQICYHCGQVITAGQECIPGELELERRGQFLAHRQCHDFSWLIHLSEQQYALVTNDPRIKVKDLIKRVDDERFSENVKASIKKLKQPKWRYILNAALEWLREGDGK